MSSTATQRKEKRDTQRHHNAKKQCAEAPSLFVWRKRRRQPRSITYPRVEAWFADRFSWRYPVLVFRTLSTLFCCFSSRDTWLGCVARRVMGSSLLILMAIVLEPSARPSPRAVTATTAAHAREGIVTFSATTASSEATSTASSEAATTTAIVRSASTITDDNVPTPVHAGAGCDPSGNHGLLRKATLGCDPVVGCINSALQNRSLLLGGKLAIGF